MAIVCFLMVSGFLDSTNPFFNSIERSDRIRYDNIILFVGCRWLGDGRGEYVDDCDGRV